MASVSNIFHGHIEMDMTYNLLSFLKHAGLEIFVDFLTTKNEKQNFFDEHFLLNKIKEAEDADDIVFTVEQPTQVKDGRMDGIIRSETEQDDFMIVIESKRDEQAREWQLKKYSDDLESKSIDKNKCLLVSLSGWIDKGIEPTKGVIYKTWKELVKHLEKQSKPTQCSQNENIQKHFLIEQFKQYLEERGYGMYKPIIIKELMEYEVPGQYKDHNSVISLILKNYEKLSAQLDLIVRQSYERMYDGKELMVKLSPDKIDKKEFLKWSSLMNLWYGYNVENTWLTVRLSIKNYQWSRIEVILYMGKKDDDYICKFRKCCEEYCKEKNILGKWYELTWGEKIHCGYCRELKRKETDAILREDFDSEPFKKMLADYCMLLHFAEQFASENT